MNSQNTSYVGVLRICYVKSLECQAIISLQYLFLS